MTKQSDVDDERDRLVINASTAAHVRERELEMEVERLKARYEERLEQWGEDMNRLRAALDESSRILHEIGNNGYVVSEPVADALDAFMAKNGRIE